MVDCGCVWCCIVGCEDVWLFLWCLVVCGSLVVFGCLW